MHLQVEQEEQDEEAKRIKLKAAFDKCGPQSLRSAFLTLHQLLLASIPRQREAVRGMMKERDDKRREDSPISNAIGASLVVQMHFAGGSCSQS